MNDTNNQSQVPFNPERSQLEGKKKMTDVQPETPFQHHTATHALSED